MVASEEVASSWSHHRYCERTSSILRVHIILVQARLHGRVDRGHAVKETTKVATRECVSECIVEQIVEVPASQIRAQIEQVVNIVPQVPVLSRTKNRLWRCPFPKPGACCMRYQRYRFRSKLWMLCRSCVVQIVDMPFSQLQGVAVEVTGHASNVARVSRW